MTNEEAKVFLDNLKICIEEHPIIADWLIEIADRKTENSSEKPNNCDRCQHHYDGTAEYCRTCGASNFQPKDEPQTDCAWK